MQLLGIWEFEVAKWLLGAGAVEPMSEEYRWKGISINWKTIVSSEKVHRWYSL